MPFLNRIVGERETVDHRTLPLVKMPNRNGFIADPVPTSEITSVVRLQPDRGEPHMAVSTVTHHRWSDLAPEAINTSIARRYITAERVTIARFELKRGGLVPMHAHENEQVSIVIDGVLRFRIEGREVVVRGGEAMQIPPHVPHEVEVIEDTLVFDVFSPIRQDWIDKTDTYFRR